MGHEESEPEVTRLGQPGPEQAAARQARERATEASAEKDRYEKMRANLTVAIVTEMRRLEKVLGEIREATDAGEEVTRRGEFELHQALQQGLDLLKVKRAHEAAQAIRNGLGLDHPIVKDTPMMQKWKQDLEALGEFDKESASQ